jgi:hypothetical protein
MASFLADVFSGLTATLLAAAITIAVVAEIKIRRLKSEFHVLRDYLRLTHHTRCATDVAAPQADRMREVKQQLGDLMHEISAAKDGVLSFSHGFKKKIRRFEQDVNELVDERFANDWIRLLFGDESSVEQEFRRKILSLSQRADDLAGELWFGTLIIP